MNRLERLHRNPAHKDSGLSWSEFWTWPSCVNGRPLVGAIGMRLFVLYPPMAPVCVYMLYVLFIFIQERGENLVVRNGSAVAIRFLTENRNTNEEYNNVLLISPFFSPIFLSSRRISAYWWNTRLALKPNRIGNKEECLCDAETRVETVGWGRLTG